MNSILHQRHIRVVLLLLCAVLFQQHLLAQIEIFIVPNMDKSDTFTKMEPAARKWFELNRKSDDKENRVAYKSCKKNESGSSVIVVTQRTWINRAGDGGAAKPESVTDDPAEESTNIQIETIVPAEKEIKPADQTPKAAAATAAEKQKEIAALKSNPQKDESRSNFAPLANIPTPSPASLSAINARATEMASTFKDITRDASGNTTISKFEAEGAAILESTFNLRMRGLKAGEKGDFTVISGTITTDRTTVDVAGKTIDQMGIPAAAVPYFKLKEFTASIKTHFAKPVDFILMDVRHLPANGKDSIKDYLIKNHSKDFRRLITIGF